MNNFTAFTSATQTWHQIRCVGSYRHHYGNAWISCAAYPRLCEFNVSLSHLYGCSSSYKLLHLQDFIAVSLVCPVRWVQYPAYFHKGLTGFRKVVTASTRGTVRCHLRAQDAQYRFIRSYRLVQEHTVWHGLMFKYLQISNHPRRVSLIHLNNTCKSLVQSPATASIKYQSQV